MMTNNEISISVVVPVYKEEGNINKFLQELVPVLEGITSSYEVLFSMDPSPDNTEKLIEEANQQNPRVKLIKLSRRFGQPMATIAGLSHTSGDVAIVMDVDLQDPPEVITQLVEKHREGFDVVLARRKSREGETLIKKVVSAVGYKVIREFGEVEIPRDTGDFRLMSRRVVERIVSLKESHGFLRGLVSLVGFSKAEVLFDRPARFSGAGNYNRFFGSLKIGLNGLFCFSAAPLKVSSMLGFATAFLAFGMGLLYAVLKLGGVPFPIGNPTIVILVLFLGGVQLISVGVLGEYIARIYDEVKCRPKFIVDKLVGIQAQPSAVILPRSFGEQGANSEVLAGLKHKEVGNS